MSRILTPSQAAYYLAATRVRDIQEAIKDKVSMRDAVGIIRLEKEYRIAEGQLRFAIRGLKGERTA